MRAPNEGSNYGSAGLTVDSEYLGETLATYTEAHQLQRNSTHVIIPWNTTWTRYNGDPIANHQSTRILGFCTVQYIYDRITYSILYIAKNERVIVGECTNLIYAKIWLASKPIQFYSNVRLFPDNHCQCLLLHEIF